MIMHRHARVTIRHRQTDIARLNRWLEQQGIELSDKFSEVAARSLQAGLVENRPRHQPVQAAPVDIRPLAQVVQHIFSGIAKAVQRVPALCCTELYVAQTAPVQCTAGMFDESTQHNISSLRVHQGKP